MSVEITVDISPTTVPGTNDGDYHRVRSAGGAISTTANVLVLGSAAKGNVDELVWLMFEPNLPADATINTVELQLYVFNRTGTATLNYRVGWLAVDGTWNLQTSNLGWNEYANAAALPKPTSGVPATDATWQNSEPSFDLSTDIGAPGTFPTWGGGLGVGSDFVSAAFLTDFQDLFDANEVNRNSVGVPVACMLISRIPINARNYSFRSVNWTTAAERPKLTINYSPPPIDSELSGTATLDADAVKKVLPTSEVSADATVDAAGSGVFREEAELTTNSLLFAIGEVNEEATAELLSFPTTVDADALKLLLPESELSADATLVADQLRRRFADRELNTDATLDADSFVRKVTDIEVSADATVDAAPGAAREGASELTSTTLTFAVGEVNEEATAELVAGIGAFIDADAVRKALAAQPFLFSQSNIIPEASVKAPVASELSVVTSIEAAAERILLAFLELDPTAILDATGSAIFRADLELVAEALLDAIVRGDATAENPVEVTATAGNTTVTAASADIQVTAFSDNATVEGGSANASV